MRIATHIALQAAFLTVSTVGLSLQVYRELSQAELTMAEVVDDGRDLQVCARVEDSIGHLLLLGDLVFGGGTSYLAPVGMEQAQQLRELLKSISESPLREGPADLLPQLSEEATAIEHLLQAGMELGGSDREERLNELLLEFDRRSMALAEAAEALCESWIARRNLRQELARQELAASSRYRLLYLGLLILTVLASWRYLVAVVVRPLTRLRHSARAAREGGQFHPRPSSIRDFDSLSRSFEELVASLEQAKDGMEETVRVRTQELELALKARSLFLANTSHELRTPMNAIMGFSELLRNQELGEVERATYLTQIQGSGTHLLGLIESVLDLVSMESGTLTAQLESFEPEALVRTCLSPFEQRARQKGLDFRIQLNPSLPRLVQSDPARLRQVLIHLVDNAIKFTDRGQVEVGVGWADDQLELLVRDSGSGISADKQGTIFTAFQQADASHTRSHSGAGLGLTLSRCLVELLEGELSLESEPGEGTQVRVRMKARRAEPKVAARQGSPGEACRILVVDDVPSNRLLVRRILKHLGLVAVEAADGQQAVKAMEQATREGEPIHGVLMDLQMPVMDGYQATEALRSGGYRGPILALSAAVLPEQQAAALAAGCDDFLPKPISVDRLKAELSHHLGTTGGAPAELQSGDS